jgi:hypothetical protein
MASFPRVACVAAVAACYLGAAFANSYDYGNYKDYNVREVTKKDLKCAGAPGHPYVHYVPCEEGYHCVEKDSYGADEWGRYCLPIPTGYYDGKCYKTGEKCMGTAGKPYVEYLPCCSKGDACRELGAEDTAYGYGKEDVWGSFCVPYGDKPSEGGKVEYKTPEYVSKNEYDTKFYDYKCHLTGYKCQGGPGFPHVENGNGCCYSSDSCVPDAYMGWGKFCKPLSETYSAYEKYKESPSSYNPPTPKYEDWYSPPQGSYNPPTAPYNPYAPTKCYGLGCKDEARTPTSLDTTIADAFGLGSNFGCAAPGTPSATTDSIPDPLDGESAVTVSVPAPSCSGASVFSDADARALLSAICARVSAVAPGAKCYIQSAPAPSVRMAVGRGYNLDVAERQGGFVITIYIIFATQFAAAVAQVLQVLVALIRAIIDFLLSASPTV